MKALVYACCFSAVLFFLRCASVSKPPAPAAPAGPGANQPMLRIDLTKAPVLPPSETVEIDYDEYFKKTGKRYAAVSLRAVLAAAVREHAFDTSGAIVAFECSDGYAPTMPLSRAWAGKGYLATRDLSAPPGKNWPDGLEQSFTPYYLVWDELAPGAKDYVWPYGLTALRLLDGKNAFEKVFPLGAPHVEKGFALFRDNCMKCHALNRTGGTMGPEFNIPRNITEYWTEQNIAAFARAPRSFRVSSQMPAMDHLSDAEFQEILAYLKFMAGRKTL